MRFPNTTSMALAVFVLTAMIGCGGMSGSQVDIPESPDGTVRVVLDGLVQHHPEVVWRALPPSYQQDVNDLTIAFADTVDPVVYERAVAVLRKGVVVLQSKKELVLGSETFSKSQVDAETADAFWEAAVHLIDAFLASDVADLTTLREIDVESFLSTTGASMMDHAANLPAENEEMESFSQRVEALRDAEVELMSQEGDHAVVVVLVPDEDPVELRLVRVEERWIPEKMASQWPQAVEEAHSKIEYLGSEESAQFRVQALFGIGVVEGFIDQIELMETSDQVDDLIGGILGNFMGQQQAGQAVTEG